MLGERGLYDSFIGYLDGVLKSLVEIPDDWNDRGWLQTDLLPSIARHIAGAPDDGIRDELLDRYRRLQQLLSALPPPAPRN